MNYEKKMTQEQKAKAYDKALGWMRELYPGLHGATKEDAEHYFPELAESEDEKIRMWLIDCVKAKHDCYFETVTREQVLSYLEKQKENHKSADSIPADCVSLAKCEDRDSKYGVFPEDVIVVARACEKLEAHGYPELAHALKNVNLYTKEQKPAEWSEEDENKIMSIKSLITTGRYVDTNTIRIIWDMLDSLHPQPHWKPSEEQMEALEHAKDACEEEWGYEDTALRSLINDLKTKL